MRFQQNNKQRRLLPLWTVYATIILTVAIPAHSATITASSGLPAVKGKPINTFSAAWLKTGVTAKDTISWTSGANTADGKNFAQTAYGPEPYFGFAANGAPVAGPLKGFLRVDVGPKATEVITAGFGNSAVGKDLATSTYSVLAIGLTLNPPNFQYTATASANDPWSYSASDFASFDPLQNVDMFFSSAILSGDLGNAGTLGFVVDWTTAAGTLHLLNIAIAAMTVTVTQDVVPGLQIYQLQPGNMTPDGIAGPPLTLSDIQALLLASMGSGTSLQTPLNFGFMLNGVPFPTATLSDGTLGSFGASITVQDQGANSSAPEPGTWALIGAGLLCLGKVSRTRQPA